MRFPLVLTARIAGHLIRHKIRRTGKFATVLQLEPLHTCNLSCTGCGRIREYSTALKDRMSLADCLGAADECDAPMVSICGGEPLIYPEIEGLVHCLLEQKRIVYLCTNGLLMRKKLREYLASELLNLRAEGESTAHLEGVLRQLQADGLVSASQAEEIREGTCVRPRTIRPTRWMYWNVHLDGLERSHDAIVERKGVFRECIAAIRMAKALGFQVATNTTVYRETDMNEISQLFDYLSWLGVDGHTISPGYDYDAARDDMRKRLGTDPDQFFLTRRATIEKFRDIREWGAKYRILGTPVYLDFLAGKRNLPCSAWAIPTRNAHGWKGPCYLMTDAHHATFRDLLEKTRWETYGVDGETPRDPRCANCMVHCGFEPSATLGIDGRPGDTWANIAFNFGPLPPPRPEGAQVNAFNGDQPDPASEAPCP